ncbi:hypothetical protein PVAP13_3KG413700 [Panicum virgatum]|uniref:Uncharacterized protein n=1 Tax=Panicum virgatum TaxID=38727 RepID=A0A8T0VA21_PANVG|nr:hypothetical protein PVAP13_3KG413700 [Panicum virgatum]
MTLALRPVFVHPGSLAPPPGAATQTCSAHPLARQIPPPLAHPLACQIPPPLAHPLGRQIPPPLPGLAPALARQAPATAKSLCRARAASNFPMPLQIPPASLPIPPAPISSAATAGRFPFPQAPAPKSLCRTSARREGRPPVSTRNMSRRGKSLPKLDGVPAKRSRGTSSSPTNTIPPAPQLQTASPTPAPTGRSWPGCGVGSGPSSSSPGNEVPNPWGGVHLLLSLRKRNRRAHMLTLVMTPKNVLLAKQQRRQNAKGSGRRNKLWMALSSLEIT